MDNEEEYTKAYTELSCLLSIMPKELTEQIPPYAKSAIKSRFDDKYVVTFDDSNPVEKYNFSRKTKSLLAVLKFNCWADDDEKKRLLALFESNDAGTK